jgi:hypothetical protein
MVAELDPVALARIVATEKALIVLKRSTKSPADTAAEIVQLPVSDLTWKLFPETPLTVTNTLELR